MEYGPGNNSSISGEEVGFGEGSPNGSATVPVQCIFGGFINPVNASYVGGIFCH